MLCYYYQHLIFIYMSHFLPLALKYNFIGNQ